MGFGVAFNTYKLGMEILRFLVRSLLFSILAAGSAFANIDIPVTQGPGPTCLGRLYSDILAPSQWGSDTGAATRFVQSAEGVLGVTIFFEIGPYGEPNSYPFNGNRAMVGVGETSINRYRNNDSVQNINNHHEVSRGGLIAVIKESQVWHHETYHGEGTLLEKQRTRFYNILNGSPYSQDCGGLMNSWLVAQNMMSYHHYTSHPPAMYVDVVNRPPAPGSLFYASSSSFGDVTLPGVSTVNRKYVQSLGSWEVPTLGSHYFENFFTLSNAVPSNYAYPFI